MGKTGRTRGFWKLTRAGLYDRYGEAVVPGWAQLLLLVAVVALGGLVVWLATGPSSPGHLQRLLALALPFVAALVVLLMGAGGREEE